MMIGFGDMELAARARGNGERKMPESLVGVLFINIAGGNKIISLVKLA